ncbi:uncharacterized protein B0I36DRAFT_435752 [Microdochium trichocladiopsis]|uniref:Uncharacterized protein n=1 Tax=Microdochium trichocladiopsis TaxID=1682393 RepID=A0A9P8XUN5_9PEZI|nr:uncharacterized protein B0I36DRAFT_435752 [Microdochium trichocladiopsis]KAH7018444.1 hypothetical protein B0I36DRAFT_435752 [Microdochium trichocladiopsis]
MATNTYPNIWRKRHNLTAWILQILASLVYLILAIWSSVMLSRSSIRHSYNSSYRISVSMIIVMVFSVVTIIFDIIEIIFYRGTRLSPVLMLVFSTVKTVTWGVYFIMVIISAAVLRAPIGLIIDGPLSFVLLATAVSQLVISAIFVHRRRRTASLAGSDDAVPKHDV